MLFKNMTGEIKNHTKSSANKKLQFLLYTTKATMPVLYVCYLHLDMITGTLNKILC